MSFSGRVQLCQWLFYGKLHYVLQSSILPLSVIDKIKSMSYNFIWGTQCGISWKAMMYVRLEGSMGMCNFRHLQIAAIIEHVGCAWTHKGIWASCVRKCFVGRSALTIIRPRYNNNSSCSNHLQLHGLQMEGQWHFAFSLKLYSYLP